jgi:deoxyadenosine/deoxycytidine kinase
MPNSRLSKKKSFCRTKVNTFSREIALDPNIFNEHLFSHLDNLHEQSRR